MLRIIFLAAALAGCVQAQRPYQFTAAAPDPFDAIARVLAQNGYTNCSIDRQIGVITTHWEDTGWGTIAPGFDGGDGTVVRRYIITVQRRDRDNQISLRADTQNCRRGDFQIVGDLEVRGNCARMDHMFPPHQRALDELGRQLQQAL